MKIKYPLLNIKMVNYNEVQANNYNPNNVSSDKMKLLKQSIIDNGFLFPIITIFDNDLEKYVIVDGFHRYVVLGQLNQEKIPIIVLEKNISERLYTTVQMNKAKGVHQVDLDADIIKTLLENGESEKDISEHLGIDLETIQRYKNLSGIVSLFENVEYSSSWDITEGDI